ncbi:VPLPA-CTERM sorting domain-containing protein, partial [Streptomyces zhihengii]
WSKDDSEKSDGEKKSWKHDKPHGGVHAGGGALADVSGDETAREGKESSGSGKWEKESGDEEKSWKHDKPKGGVHTGGGGTALSGGGLAAGAVLLLGGIGAGALVMRRRGVSGTAA